MGDLFFDVYLLFSLSLIHIYAHHAALIADLLHVLADLVAGVHRVVAAVVEEVADVILLEDLQDVYKRQPRVRSPEGWMPLRIRFFCTSFSILYPPQILKLPGISAGWRPVFLISR